jgi:hypothetical protein
MNLTRQCHEIGNLIFIFVLFVKILSNGTKSGAYWHSQFEFPNTFFLLQQLVAMTRCVCHGNINFIMNRV